MNNTSHPNATSEVGVEANFIPITILSLLSIATITTNGLVLLTIFKDPLKCLRSPSACFIAGLTTANLLTGLLVEPAFIYWLINGNRGDLVGWVAVLLSVTVINASLLIILAMAVTQYIVVSSPALYRKIVSSKSAKIGVLCIFLYAIFFSLLPVMGIDVWLFFEVDMFLHTTLITVSVVVIYILMYCKFRRQWGPARSPEERGSDESEQQKQAIQRDFTKGTFILTAFMILTVWPYTITEYLLRYHEFEESEVTSYVIAYIICLCIFMTKFALDPVIFAWRLKTYRQSFLVVFRRICSCGDTSALPPVSYHVADDDNEGLVEEPVESVVA